jgi:hypothetical protein
VDGCPGVSPRRYQHVRGFRNRLSLEEQVRPHYVDQFAGRDDFGFLHREVANTSLCNDATDSDGRFGRLPAAHSSDQRHRSKGSKI